MDKCVKKYLRREYAKGRSPAAVIIDMVGIRTAVFFGAAMAYLLITRSFYVSLALAGITVFGFSWAMARVNAAGFEKFCLNFYEEAKESRICEKLLLMPEEEIRRMVKKAAKSDGFGSESYVHFFDKHPMEEVSPGEVLSCVREARKNSKEQAVCYTLGGYSKEAQNFAREQGAELKGKEGIVKEAVSEGMAPTDAEMEEIFRARGEALKMDMKKLWREALAAGKFRSYVITGTVMGVLAFVLGGNIFLLSMAALCIFMGVLTCVYKYKNT